MCSKAAADTRSYLQGSSPRFEAEADVCLVVQGQELPVHSQILWRYCRFFDQLFTDISDLQQAQAGGTGGSTTAAITAAATLTAAAASAATRVNVTRLEAPFRDVQLQHVLLFLNCLYRPDFVPELGDLAAFQGVAELADRLDSGLLQGALSARLASAAPEVEAMLQKDLLGWIEFSDRCGWWMGGSGLGRGVEGTNGRRASHPELLRSHQMCLSPPLSLPLSPPAAGSL